MITEANSQLFTQASMAATVTSAWVDVSRISLASVQFVWAGGGAVGGTLKLQYSNRPLLPGASDGIDFGTTIAVAAGAGNASIEMNPVPWRWMRAVFANTSGGAGDTLDAYYTGKTLG